MHIYTQFSLVQSLFVIWKVIVVAFSLLLSNLLHAKFVFLFILMLSCLRIFAPFVLVFAKPHPDICQTLISEFFQLNINREIEINDLYAICLCTFYLITFNLVWLPLFRIITCNICVYVKFEAPLCRLALISLSVSGLFI